jgi:hypothetical protein
MSKRNYSFLALLAGIALSSATASAAPPLGGVGASVNAGAGAGINAGASVGGMRGGINGSLGAQAPGALPQTPGSLPSSVHSPAITQQAQTVTADVKAQALRGYRAVVVAISGNSVTITTAAGVTQTFTLANPSALNLKVGQHVAVGMRNGTLIMTHVVSSNAANVSVRRAQHKRNSASQAQSATGSQAQK